MPPPLWMHVMEAAVASVRIYTNILLPRKTKGEEKTKPPQIKRNGEPCTICNNEANVTFLPCGHTIMCRPCVKVFIEQENERCPDVFCRARIDDFQKMD